MRRLVLIACLLATLPARAQFPATLPAGTTPFLLGVVDSLRSTILGETRTLNIYLPDGYSSNDTARYPVIYLLDGSRNEDFIHVAGLVQYSSFPWIDRLRPSIVVGIANVDRKHDFTTQTAFEQEKKLIPNAGGSTRFIAFLERELQPFIERRYRTAPSRTLVGESLGGLLTTEVLLRKPALFNRYLITSPSLWWNDTALLHLPLQPLQQTTRRTDVYIGVGKEGPTPGAKPHLMEDDARLLVDRLRSTGNPALHVHFDFLPDENHATMGHQGIQNGFRLLGKD